MSQINRTLTEILYNPYFESQLALTIPSVALAASNSICPSTQEVPFPLNPPRSRRSKPFPLPCNLVRKLPGYTFMLNDIGDFVIKDRVGPIKLGGLQRRSKDRNGRERKDLRLAKKLLTAKLNGEKLGTASDVESDACGSSVYGDSECNSPVPSSPQSRFRVDNYTLIPMDLDVFESGSTLAEAPPRLAEVDEPQHEKDSPETPPESLSPVKIKVTRSVTKDLVSNLSDPTLAPQTPPPPPAAFRSRLPKNISSIPSSPISPASPSRQTRKVSKCSSCDSVNVTRIGKLVYCGDCKKRYDQLGLRCTACSYVPTKDEALTSPECHSCNGGTWLVRSQMQKN